MPRDPLTGAALPYDALPGALPPAQPPEYDPLDDVLSTGMLFQMFGGDLAGLQRTLQEGFNPSPYAMSPELLGRLPTQATGFEGLVTGGFEGRPGAMERVNGGFLPSGATERSALRDAFQSRTGFDPRSAQNWVRLSDGTLVERRPDGGLTTIGGAQTAPLRREPLTPAHQARARDFGIDPEKLRTKLGGAITSAPSPDLTPEREAEARQKFAARDAAIRDPALWRDLGGEAERLRGAGLLRDLQAGAPRDLLAARAKQPTALEAFGGALRRDEAEAEKAREAKFQKALLLMSFGEKVDARKEANAIKRERAEAARHAAEQTQQQNTLTKALEREIKARREQIRLLPEEQRASRLLELQAIEREGHGRIARGDVDQEFLENLGLASRAPKKGGAITPAARIEGERHREEALAQPAGVTPDDVARTFFPAGAKPSEIAELLGTLPPSVRGGVPIEQEEAVDRLLAWRSNIRHGAKRATGTLAFINKLRARGMGMDEIRDLVETVLKNRLATGIKPGAS